MPEEKNSPAKASATERRQGFPPPEKELPPPHDMQLAAGDGSKPPTTPSAKQAAFMPSFWAKYGSKKWLLPLIIIIVALVIVVGAAAFMGASNDPMTRREKRMERQEKRIERQQRKQNKNNKNNKNNKKRNKNNNKNAKANANANFVSFTYGTGANKIIMQYPGNMKVNISNGVSILDNTTQVPLITFIDNNTIMRMKIEPNTNNLSAASWQASLSKENDTYNTPTETLTVSGKPAAIQHTLSETANWLAYVPMSSKMLVVDMNYGGGKNKAKEEMVAILKTLQIGTVTAPSALPVTTAPTQSGM